MQELTAHQRAVKKYHKKWFANNANIVIKKTLRDELKTLAHSQNVSISQFIELLLKNYNS